MPADEVLCRQCEMFTFNEENDNGWCCEFGLHRSYNDPAPEKCIPEDEQ